MKDRERFEQWAESMSLCINKKSEVGVEDPYIEFQTQMNWWTWQAAQDNRKETEL